MAKRSFDVFGEKKNTVVINGQTMTVDEWKKMCEESKSSKTAPKKKREKSYIRTLVPYIQNITKNVKVLKSLASYYDHGRKEFGLVCYNNIICHPMISSAFIKYRSKTREIEDILKSIELVGGKNESDVFQYIEKLSWKIEDVSTAIRELTDSVSESRVLEFYKNEKCVYEEGKRLGLRTLMCRGMISMNEICNLSKELNDIALKRLDDFDYDPVTGRRIR